MAGPRPVVLIFRKRILPWSETFIGAQARALTRYRPVLAGYHRDPGGAAYVSGIPQLLLDELSRFAPLEKLLLKKRGRVPRRWLRALAAERPTLLHAHFWSSTAPGRHLPALGSCGDVPRHGHHGAASLRCGCGKPAEGARGR
jgi:hypothetical protein